MNLENIKKIVNGGHPNWKALLLNEIASDPQAIGYVMEMLDYERKENKQLITDLNFELSRAHLAIVHPEANKEGFVQKEITKFYDSGRIGHCFNMKDEQP